MFKWRLEFAFGFRVGCEVIFEVLCRAWCWAGFRVSVKDTFMVGYMLVAFEVSLEARRQGKVQGLV
jgi:hypothetical protein